MSYRVTDPNQLIPLGGGRCWIRGSEYIKAICEFHEMRRVKTEVLNGTLTEMSRCPHCRHEEWRTLSHTEIIDL
jgi:hypothetical protein